ncbi:MAG: DUF2949 domain-containing protein [Calothrix sp. FI2-JRJ7]|jgi:hypothetical protein|nr:DUF2949 domain-containing protein [Calothrix sp. FI2-JRJ7]
METIRMIELVSFLQKDLAIPASDLQLALRHPEQTPNSLPMILWQYGLVTLSQLDQIFDWLQRSF